MADRAHALDEVPPRPGPPRARFGTAQGRGERELRRVRRRGDVHFSAARARDRDHGTACRKTVRVFVDRGRGPVPRFPGVLPGYARSGVYGRHRSSYPRCAGMASRLASQARYKTLDRVPTLPYARRAAAPETWRGGAARCRDLADLDRGPGWTQGGADGAGKGLRVAEIDGRQALELQERVARLRAVPA